MEALIGAFAGGLAMLAVMVSGYVIMIAVLGLAFVGGFAFVLHGLVRAVFDETVDPFRDLRDSHTDINFVEKEVDLRLAEQGTLTESKVDNLKIAG